jgi:hypothetical protein
MVMISRVGDEKENCLGQLKNERENFEQQVFTLVQQQEQVLKEREGMIAYYTYISKLAIFLDVCR